MNGNLNKSSPLLAVILMISAFFITGCATTQENLSEGQAVNKRMMAAADQLDSSKKTVIVVVPGAGNTLSDGMMPGLLNTGTETDAVRQIASAIQADANYQVVVTGSHDAIAAASLRAALNSLRKKDNLASVYYIGDPEHQAELKSAAKKAGVDLDVVAYPAQE